VITAVFIGGPIDGQEGHVEDGYPEWSVPLPPSTTFLSSSMRPDDGGFDVCRYRMEFFLGRPIRDKSGRYRFTYVPNRPRIGGTGR
jgi:hypothetical protein